MRVRSFLPFALVCAAAPCCAAEPNNSVSAEAAERHASSRTVGAGRQFLSTLLLATMAGALLSCDRANEVESGPEPLGLKSKAAVPDRLSNDHRQCGLTAANVRDETLIAVSLTDPGAEAKLSCLARRGDYEVLGHFSHELFRWDGAPPRDRHQRAYRWGMVALRNYLSSLNINLEDPSFFEKYREIGKKPGSVNPDDFFDNIYYYSDVPRALIEAGDVIPAAAERQALAIIKSQRPSDIIEKE